MQFMTDAKRRQVEQLLRQSGGDVSELRRRLHEAGREANPPRSGGPVRG